MLIETQFHAAPPDLLRSIAVYLELSDMVAFAFGDSYKITAGENFEDGMLAQ